MSYENCPKCNRYVWLETHTCQPTFICWCPEYGQTMADARRVRGRDHEDAAIEWATRFDRDSADYLIVRGNDAAVHVAHEDGGDEQVLVVSGEMVASYSARRKDGA